MECQQLALAALLRFGNLLNWSFLYKVLKNYPFSNLKFQEFYQKFS